MTQNANIVRFPSTHHYAGYGYNFDTDRVLSFKRWKSHPDGYPLQRRVSYNLLGRWRPATHHETVRHNAAVVRESTGGHKATKATTLATPATTLSAIRPSYPYVLFSKKNQCSQYFFANTTLADALERLARRGEVIAIEDVRILNVNTNEVKSLVAKTTVTTYTLA